MTLHYPGGKTPKPAPRPASKPIRITPAPKRPAKTNLTNLIERASKDHNGRVKGR